MADPPDLSTLAKGYIDLWQDQLIALAAQPELAEGLARLLRAMPVVIWPNPLGDAPGPQGTAPKGNAHDHNGHATPDRPAAAAAPSGRGDIDLRELASRLAALEERLARLEAGIKGLSKRPAKSTRRRRT